MTEGFELPVDKLINSYLLRQNVYIFIPPGIILMVQIILAGYTIEGIFLFHIVRPGPEKCGVIGFISNEDKA